MKKDALVGNVVAEYMIGNTKIKICDDAYRDKTPEDYRKMFKRFEDKFGYRIIHPVYAPEEHAPEESSQC